jgi:hypothetical protein
MPSGRFAGRPESLSSRPPMLVLGTVRRVRSSASSQGVPMSRQLAQAQDDVRRMSAELEAEQLADIFARDRELPVTRIRQDHVGGSCQLRPPARDLEHSVVRDVPFCRCKLTSVEMKR